MHVLKNEIHPKLVKLAVDCQPQRPEHFLLNTNVLPMMIPSAHIRPDNLNVIPDVHFLRTQRRYNKRRYARVRATSRPSF